jgi:hypothetical protein
MDEILLVIAEKIQDLVKNCDNDLLILIFCFWYFDGPKLQRLYRKICPFRTDTNLYKAEQNATTVKT